MADKIATNIRMQAARERITQACVRLALVTGLEPPDLSQTHRIPEIAAAIRQEVLAAFLEDAAKKLPVRKPGKGQTHGATDQ